MLPTCYNIKVAVRLARPPELAVLQSGLAVSLGNQPHQGHFCSRHTLPRQPAVTAISSDIYDVYQHALYVLSAFAYPDITICASLAFLAILSKVALCIK